MFDWAEYRTLAQALSSNAAESAQRSAISRAYYYAFNTARAYVEKRDRRSLSRHDAHQEVWQALAGPRPGLRRQEMQAGETGKRLRVQRNDADYNAAMSNAPAMCQLALKEADKIVRLLLEST